MNMLDPRRKVLASQPFSVLLGAELLGLSPGMAEIKVPIRPQLGQQHGFVHGGVIRYAADNALTFAGGACSGLPWSPPSSRSTTSGPPRAIS